MPNSPAALNCCVAPFTSVADPGEMITRLNVGGGGAVTTTTAVASSVPERAQTSVVPDPTPETSPLPLTVATPWLSLVQLTGAPPMACPL